MSLKIKCAKCNCIMVEKDEKLFCDYCDTTREIPERLVHIVTSSYGNFDSYNHTTIDKVFFSEEKANKYKNDYNVKLITEQTQTGKCMNCPFAWGKNEDTVKQHAKEEQNFKCYKESEDKFCCISSDRLGMAFEQYPAEVDSYEIELD